MNKKIALALKRIEKDIENDDLGKARDRLHGLISAYPNELELRKMLGDIYFQLKYPAMAGRYWYLEKIKTPQMKKACMEFENSMGHDMNKIAQALKYKGDIELLEGLDVDPELLSSQYKVKDKLVEEQDVPIGPTYKLIIFGCLSVILSIIIFASVGVYTFFKWMF
ncbi:DUF6584 family protein [Sporosarcina luteola]|uniref:DUF6584 family protein n=1 Tax=Sporosarcina luteola TaxID=582850 RepID=UPI00203C14ED|nr:DNA helicase [Sporosarcina luteola]